MSIIWLCLSLFLSLSLSLSLSQFIFVSFMRWDNMEQWGGAQHYTIVTVDIRVGL
ncbi:hypothetical protein HanHA300_Chr08g0296791 [Helianthus annuus]|uniref:Uncharacterized protein n=1 Tax=Helianthus annuus TaxID=4232 RepID=A0A251U942_HELAN|nr:hypothetical protein HanHA300_Chr08g0296791 [Helianthus annuus]KAJ0555052.1 hypothetical protein HanHA89_Chr08g0315291 [Helianthus annuus]KAJ0720619.1 hypothetical protein HanLR1_Chr08g0295641 [Helianthus annuus]KAJ0723812.1 hypothetical protein HanOQP8_Chr08g0302791 [Helianthus annuus]